ncbi:uncharacterized protein LOC144144626 isoform X2 [Haemaphysalis longicornis]
MSYMSSLVSQPNDIEGGGPGNAASVIGTGACLRDKALSRLHIRHGPFQRNAFHFGLIAAFVLPFHTMPLQIAQQDVDHWCARPLSMGNVSYEQWKPQMIPRGSDGHSNRCRMFAEWNSTSAATVPCSTWDFAKPAYGASIVERFQLVCENDWLLPVSCSMFPIGAIVALLVFEPVADRLGRKPVIKFFVPLLLASVLIALLITGLSTFLITRFLVGVAATTLFTTSFALVVEVLSPNYRTLYSMAVLLGTVFGGFITALMIWLGFEWSALQLVSVLPCLVMLRRSQINRALSRPASAAKSYFFVEAAETASSCTISGRSRCSALKRARSESTASAFTRPPCSHWGRPCHCRHSWPPSCPQRGSAAGRRKRGRWAAPPLPRLRQPQSPMGLIPTSWLLSAVVSLLCLSGAVLVLTLPDTKEETTLPDAYTTPRYETSLPDAAVPQRDPTTNLGTGTRPSSRSISTAAPLDDLGLSRDRVR